MTEPDVELDKPDYDPVGHLNSIFSSASSLSRLPELQDHVALFESHLDYEELKPQILTEDELAASERVDVAPIELQSLLDQIDRLKQRAATSEKAITDMTADIKRLDSTKANLVKSITVLRRLQMLTNAYDQLVLLVKNRQYKEMAQTLPAVTELMAHFKSFRSISQIATLSKQIAEIQGKISEQIFKDFAQVIEASSSKRQQHQKQQYALSDACKVLDSLTGNLREQLIQWYCNVQLREYRSIFRNNDEAGSLDNISRRYGHMKRLLKKHNDELGQYFAQDWPVEEELCKAFCTNTREDVQILLKQAGRSVDVQLLLSALEETLEFEAFLEKRFHLQGKKFDKTISSAFLPHLNIWIEHQDKVLSNKFGQFRAPPQPQKDGGEEDEESEPTVLPSSAELFVFYKQVLAQTAKLSTGPPLLDLSNLFGKWLIIYSNQILKSIVPSRITTNDDVKTVCLALNTADYCRTTTDQLEQRIVGQLDQDQRPHVNLESQKDSFTEVINATIGLLVFKVESACDYAWREMVNTNWGKLSTVGDQSSYVTELRRVINLETTAILQHVHKDLHARLVCDKIVDVLTAVFLQKMVLCKPISEVAAEQMLLDVVVLKDCFLKLPDLRPEFNVSSTYARHVNQSVSRVETILKVILTKSEPEVLVQSYIYCVKDASVENFIKLLQLKGIPKSDSGRFIEQFHSHLKAHDDLSQDWPVLSNLRMSLPPNAASPRAAPGDSPQSHYFFEPQPQQQQHNQLLQHQNQNQNQHYPLQQQNQQPHSRVASSSSSPISGLNSSHSIFDNTKALTGLTKEGIEKGLERFTHDNKFNENFKRFFKRERENGSQSPVGR